MNKSMVFIVSAMLAACGGKDAVAPESVENEAFEDMRAAIEVVVEDPDRQKEVLSLAQEYHKELIRLREAVQVRRTELRRLNADYDATREQFHEFIEKNDAEIREAREWATNSRKAFVQATTQEEWDALTKADSKAMKKMVGVIRGI
jgi:hypothetical protein